MVPNFAFIAKLNLANPRRILKNAHSVPRVASKQNIALIVNKIEVLQKPPHQRFLF